MALAAARRCTSVVLMKRWAVVEGLVALMALSGCHDADAGRRLHELEGRLADTEAELAREKESRTKAEACAEQAERESTRANKRMTDAESKLKEASAASAAVSSTPPGELPPACEAYWKRIKACNGAALERMPASAAKDQAMKAMADAEKATRDAWTGVDPGPLSQACKTAHEALSNNPSCPKD